jgi:putative ABC transport system substrate-binding protein
MNRRHALTGIAAAIASAALAQTSAKVWRIGYLGPSAETAPKLLAAFKEGLAAYGYQDGSNTVVDYRWTNAGTRMNDESTLVASARDLVGRKADVIVASIDPAIAAARKATTTVPIVMMNATDPVGLGFVASLARPGGNVTGFTNQAPELVGKKLQVLLDVVPNAKRIGLLVSGPGPLRESTVSTARELAASRGVSIEVVEATDRRTLDAAFDALRRGGGQAVLVSDTGGGVFFTERQTLVALAAAHRLPGVFGNIEIVEAGGLMSYAPSAIDNYRNAAAFIDKILKGTKPADIPIVQPTKFELAINLKTASAMNISIPPALRLSADRLIE